MKIIQGSKTLKKIEGRVNLLEKYPLPKIAHFQCKNSIKIQNRKIKELDKIKPIKKQDFGL